MMPGSSDFAAVNATRMYNHYDSHPALGAWNWLSSTV
jgi:hypothetical protein